MCDNNKIKDIKEIFEVLDNECITMRRTNCLTRRLSSDVPFFTPPYNHIDDSSIENFDKNLDMCINCRNFRGIDSNSFMFDIKVVRACCFINSLLSGNGLK